MKKKIDWKGLECYLGVSEQGNQESIVHELSHAFDCIGKLAFKGKIGKQFEIGKLIMAKYQSQKEADLGEIRVSAMTFMVLQPLGLADLYYILENMFGNLNSLKGIGRGKIKKEVISQIFLDNVGNLKIKKQADDIRDFCYNFKEMSL